jgi:hypothetical protein
VDEQEHPASKTPAGGETPAHGEAPVRGEITPVSGPTAGSPGRDRRADGVREAITSRGAGWAVAAAMAGAVVGLSVSMTTSSGPTVVVRPEGAADLRGVAAGAVRGVPAGAVQAAVPGRAVRAQAPARMRVQAPARLHVQVPVGLPLQTPVRLRVQVPAGQPPQAQLRRQAPVSVLAPAVLPAQIPAVPGLQASVATLAPRALRVQALRGQVRVRLRIPASARIQARPAPLRLVIPGSRPAEVLPAEVPPAAAPARLRIVFQRGVPVPARLLLPANLPGQARLRIQIPARARLTPVLPAPPNW